MITESSIIYNDSVNSPLTIPYKFGLSIKLIVSIFVVVVLRQGLYSSGCPRAHYAGQAGFKFTEIFLPLLHKC